RSAPFPRRRVRAGSTTRLRDERLRAKPPTLARLRERDTTRHGVRVETLLASEARERFAVEHDDTPEQFAQLRVVAVERLHVPVQLFAVVVECECQHRGDVREHVELCFPRVVTRHLPRPVCTLWWRGR